ncbi:MAG TPA: glycoside hydrolase family 25 protein, partial [Polyangiaceae bacterium]
MTFRFPDISSHQSGMPTANLPALLAKATQGTWYTNPDYVPAKGRAAATGTVFGAYHFLEVGNGAAQADYCFSKVGKTPLMLDFEEYTSGGVLRQPKVADAVAFIDRYRALGGVTNLLYLPKWYWQKIGSPSLQPLIDRGMKLVSSVYTTYSDTGPGWSAYGGMTPVVWQYTSSATVNGFSPVDMNACKLTLDQFKQVIGAAPMATADVLIAQALRDLGYVEGTGGLTKFGQWYAQFTK